MKKVCAMMMTAAAFGALFLAGCMNREPAPVCPVPTELTSSNPALGGFDGVDMLVVVDNSSSMQEEQEILATSFFPLINSLVNPLPTWKEANTENLRIAIVSSSMGLQWGGNPFNLTDDGFPQAAVKGDCVNPLGDNGAFWTDYNGKNTLGDPIGGTVNIQEGVIKCSSDASQCPPGWICENLDTDGVGV